MFALFGMLAAAMIGFVAMVPEADEADDLDLMETGDEPDTLPDTGDILDEKTWDEESDDDAPILSSDHVYGKNIGDRFGANLFDDLVYDEPAQTGFSEGDSLTGTEDNDLIFGNDGADSLEGKAGRDSIMGDAGDDWITGDAGSDGLHGGEGDDLLQGGAGDDLLTGGEGRDTLQGGIGDDALFGQFEADYLFGGDGDDTLDGTQASTLSEAGTDEDVGDTLEGGAGDDVLILGEADLALGGAGEDTFVSGGHITETMPIIENFVPGEDILELHYDPETDAEPDVEYLETSAGTEIYLNGTGVAHLSGISASSIGEVSLIALSSEEA